jgi:hypothetical protein
MQQEPLPSTLPPVVDEKVMAASAASTTASAYNMDSDISQMEAPTFTTIDRGPSQPMISLQWDHTANLIGKKVNNYGPVFAVDKCEDQLKLVWKGGVLDGRLSR